MQRTKSEQLIQTEFDRIKSKWLEMHFRAAAGMAICMVVLELAFFFVLERIGVISGTSENYFIKYLFIPSGINFLGLLLTLAAKRHGPTLRFRTYAVSLLPVLIGFSLYTFHNIFPSLCIAFTVPMILTTAYGDLRLTSVTAAASMAGKLISDLFFHWDPGAPEKLVNSEDITDLVLSFIILGAVYAACLVMIRVEQEKNAISIQREMEKAMLRRKALTDPLTGVKNRQGLRESFDKMLEDRSGASYILVILDLDNFKSVNDSYGHQQGDRYLRELGRILNGVEGARAFRFGGDEFCLLFRDQSDGKVERSCLEVQEAFRQSKVCRELTPLTVSFGAARWESALTPSELLRRADMALYQAKRQRGMLRFYQETLS